MLPVFFGVAIGLEFMAMHRCRYRIDQWALATGVQLREARRLWFSAGNWGLWTSGSARYFNVTVADRTGIPQTGTAKVFGGFGGYAADEIEVRWT